MQNILSDLIFSTVSSNEPFTGYNNQYAGNINNKKPAWVIILSFSLVIILLLLFGQYLWNTIAIKLFPGLRRIDNIWQILGLSILVKLLVN